MTTLYRIPKVGELVVGQCKRLAEGKEGPCGLILDIGQPAFLPKSQVAPKYAPASNLASFVGRVLLVQVLRVDDENRAIVVSRREVFELEQTIS